MKNSLFLLGILPGLLTGGCGVYSFTGASVSPDTRTITIPTFTDRSANSPPYLAQTFSEKTREYFLRNTSLNLSPAEGDLRLEATITQYSLSPVAPSGTGTGLERAAQTRLTIGVRVKFTNARNKEQNFDQVFSFFQDFSQSQSFSGVEKELTETISDQIILDVFNKSVANW